MKWLIGLLAVAALVAIGFWAYGMLGVPKVEVASPERREAIRAVYATGMVRAEQIARIRPEIGGVVLQLPVKKGEEIRQGMLVMEIKEQEQQSQVAEETARVREADVAVNEAAVNLEREKKLLEQGATTQQAIDDAQAAYDRALASLRTMRAGLATRKASTGKGTILSPITGIVTDVKITQGDAVPANMEAVIILDPASFKVFADIDELDIARIRPGQEAVIAFDALPDKRFKARVERIIPQADAVTKTVPVILNMIDVVPNLSDGLTATINIVQERRPNALTVPAEAIVEERRGDAFVYVVNDHNKLERRAVQLGTRGDDYVEIVEGLREDERVVLNPDVLWKDGIGVQIDKERMRQKVKAQ